MFLSSPFPRVAFRPCLVATSLFKRQVSQPSIDQNTSAWNSPWASCGLAVFAFGFIILFRSSVPLQACCQGMMGQSIARTAPAIAAPAIKPRHIPAIPVTRILLYSSGVAQVLHEGEIEGNVLIELPFSGHDVDDVLKSLILDDAVGSKQTVVYTPAPDREAIAAKEHEEPLSFAQMLQKYRGERVSLKYQEQTYVGHVLSVENRAHKLELIETLLLMTEQGVQAVPISGLTDLNFESQALKQELNLAFAGLVKARDVTRRRVGLRFEGQGKRRVRFSYVVDAPIWRITYRLSLDEQASQLQGWVHLDNVFGYDWNEVEIVLRSGRPATFHAELFAPILAERSSVGTSVFNFPSNVTLVRQWYGFDPPVRFGDPSTNSRNNLRQSDQSRSGYGMGGMGGMGGGGMGRSNPPDQNIDPSRVIKQASSVDSKQGLLEFKLKQRVSLEAGKSASIPLWEESYPSQQFGQVNQARLLANQSFHSAESLIDLKNHSELPLLPGPVAIFEKGNFVGDSKIESTPPKDTTQILYAIDTGIQVTTHVHSETQQLQKIEHLGLNTWLVRRERTAQVIVTLQNQHQTAKLIRMTMGVPAFAKITPALEKIHPNLARLNESAPASSKTQLEYQVVYLDDQRLTTEDLLNAKELRAAAEQVLNPADQQRLRKLTKLSQSRASLSQAELQLNQQIKQLLAEQSRWSELVRKLELSADAREKYVAMIIQAEDKIATFQLQTAPIEKDLEAIQQQWQAALEAPFKDD